MPEGSKIVNLKCISEHAKIQAEYDPARTRTSRYYEIKKDIRYMVITQTYQNWIEFAKRLNLHRMNATKTITEVESRFTST